MTEPVRTYLDDVRPADDLVLPARAQRLEPSAEALASRTLRLTHGACGFVELEQAPDVAHEASDVGVARRRAGGGVVLGSVSGPAPGSAPGSVQRSVDRGRDQQSHVEADVHQPVSAGPAPAQATCRAHNRERFSSRARNTLVLPAGRWTISVHNPYEDRPLGFWLREEKDARTTLISAGGVSSDRPGHWEVVLWPGTFLVSCPLSPSPDYLLVVE